MKLFILIAILFQSVSLASDNKIDRKRDLPDFSNLPEDGSYGGHSRKPNPPYYDKKTRTLRVEALWPFESSSQKDDSMKFKVDLYQISEGGAELTSQLLELYPGNRHSLIKPHVCRKTIRPFLFRSLPISEDAYRRKELEHWQFRPDGTLERIVKKTYELNTNQCTDLSIMEFAKDGHLTKESTFFFILNDDPRKPLIQKELNQYYQKKGEPEPEWKNLVITEEAQKDGTVLIKIHKHESLLADTPHLEKGIFHYYFDPKTKTITFKKKV